MGIDDIGTVLEASLLSSSPGGNTGRHFVSPDRRIQIASATDDQHNTIRRPLAAIACWRVNDVNFEFDSSFPRPEMRGQMAPLKALMDRHPDGLLSLFGHADPVGSDDYNKALSGRRAQAIFALLTRRTDLWAELYQHNDWGDPAIKAMLAETEPATGPDGEPSPARVAQVRSNPAARLQLFALYMDRLCIDQLGAPYQLTPSQFFGGGADPGGKADYQGCSEFNPVRMFSQAENAAFEASADKHERNQENAPNRRVLGLLFRGPHADLARWPCPRVTEGTAACRKRFWSDQAVRRSFQLERREAEETHDTFACRFYDRLAGHSPCDRAKPVRLGRLLVQALDGEGRIPLAGREYVITSDGGIGPGFQSTLDDEGMLRHDQVLAGDYFLSVAGCVENTPLIVLKGDDEIPQVVCLENSRLSILVQSNDGPPIQDATVHVDGLGKLLTDPDGIANFGHVQPGVFNFTAHKNGFVAAGGATVFSVAGSGGPGANGGPPSKAQGQAAVTVGHTIGQTVLKPLQAVKPTRVDKITATLAGTASVLHPPQSLPTNPLRESSVNSKALDDSAQPPVVLVRGGGVVQLTAETDPPGQPVQWSVEANPAGTGTLPGLQSQGNQAILKTDGVGSFSLIARGATTQVVWNFVLVAVICDDQNSKATPRNGYTDASSGTRVAVRSGEFFKPELSSFDKQAWTSEIPVTLVGGGADRKLGIDKIHLGYLQNLTFSNVTGDYDGAATATLLTNSGRFLDTNEDVRNAPPAFPTVGKIQTSGGGVSSISPLIFYRGMLHHQSAGNPAQFTLTLGDSPGVGFDARIQQGPGAPIQKLVRIRGFEKYRAAVASFSADAIDMVVVHAESEWLADYDGPVASGKYTKFGAHTTNVTPWKLVAPAFNGTGADQVGFEIFPPLAIVEGNKPQVNKF